MADHHMTPDEFRNHGRSVVDWISDYQKWVETYPVRSQLAHGEIRRRLPAEPPRRGESFEAMMEDLDRVIMPGITHWQSPNFFGYFPCNASGPAILGELLSAGLNVQGMMWSTSPACTELETHVLEWMAAMLGLPARFRWQNGGGGVIQDTASSATLCALLAARERATGGASGETGSVPGLMAYASEQAHSSVEKALRIMGVGSRNLRKIVVDDSFAMDADALEAAVARDRADGLRPFGVCATVGTTASGALDPLDRIGQICRREGLWLHVDAAMAGTAAICPEFRYILRGLEHADSFCFNPHKWMFTNFDCDCFFVADRGEYTACLAIDPAYLQDRKDRSDLTIDYRNWQIPLGRRFRALKLWFVIRHYGIDGLRDHVRRHVEIAQRFAEWVRSDPDFEVLAPHPLNLVCFAHRRGDEYSRRILERVNEEGKMFVSHAELRGRYVIRMSIGQTNTEERHVRGAWDRIRGAAATLMTAIVLLVSLAACSSTGMGAHEPFSHLSIRSHKM